VVALNRQPPPAGLPPGAVAFQTCIQCHGPTGGGTSAPPLGRQSQLADPKLLKEFLETVAPPMPRLYPGVLTDKDAELIADFLKTDVLMCGTPKEKQSCAPPAPPSSGGTKAWQAVYSVLTFPRCLNCYPTARRTRPIRGRATTIIPTIIPCFGAIPSTFRLQKIQMLLLNPESDHLMNTARIATGSRMIR